VAAWHCPRGPNRRAALMHWFELVARFNQFERI
jgi:hypothetical protein